MQKQQVSTLHGESARGEGMTLSHFNNRAKGAYQIKKTPHRVSFFLVREAGLEPARP